MVHVDLLCEPDEGAAVSVTVLYSSNSPGEVGRVSSMEYGSYGSGRPVWSWPPLPDDAPDDGTKAETVTAIVPYGEGFPVFDGCMEVNPAHVELIDVLIEFMDV